MIDFLLGCLVSFVVLVLTLLAMAPLGAFAHVCWQLFLTGWGWV